MSKTSTEGARLRELEESLASLRDLHAVTKDVEISTHARRITARAINKVAEDVPMLADLLVSSVLERLRNEGDQ